MFVGMAVWVLLLDRSTDGAPPAWAGWAWPDVLLTTAAAYCLSGMAGFVWGILLYQWELRGRPPVHPLTRNLGSASWRMLACIVAVYAFALGPYRLSTAALPLGAAPGGWLATGVLVGLVFGPGLLALTILLGGVVNDPFRWEGAQVEFFAPRVGGRAGPAGAVVGMLLLVVVLGPCAEELLFRGVVYPGLRNELGAWAAVPLSGLIFGLFHRHTGWSVVAVATLFGMVFALLAEGSGSLWPGILAHVLINCKIIAAYFGAFRAPVDHPPEVASDGAEVGQSEPASARDPAPDIGSGCS
jgi:membrane protease YdiL (CAAX protease family)